MLNALKNLYFRLTIDKPVITLIVATMLIGGLGFFADRVNLDASADSLTLENDQDLQYYRSIRARYGSDDFLIITYTPSGDLLAEASLDDIKVLRDEILQLERVRSVTSLLDVPLIRSPRVTLAEIRKQVRTLETPGVDREMARQEFHTSPVYSNLIVSPDGKSTALLAYLHHDETYQSLLDKRNELREQRLNRVLSGAEQVELEEVSQAFKRYSAALKNQQSADIASVRAILDQHRSDATIFLGGVPMIVADMIDFIRSDIKILGLGVLCFLILLLSLSFKKVRWVFLPISICFAASIGMMGYLGLVESSVTVVSSNFISILLIITLSLTVHLIVRYEELHDKTPDGEQRILVQETIRSKAIPSFYTSLTTMVAFGSLLVSSIRPVIDFGWMMVWGVAISFVLAFLIFPSVLSLMKPGQPIRRRFDYTGHITRFIAEFIEKHSNKTLAAFVVFAVLSIIGISSLTVENRFIDYFKKSTEISQGMLMIDNNLGGTTPLDVILDPDDEFFEMQNDIPDVSDLPDRSDPVAPMEISGSKSSASGLPAQSDKSDVFDEYDDYGDDEDFYMTEDSSGISGDSYWFNIFRLQKVQEVHTYLDQLPETGKVLSLSSTMDMLTQINNDEPLENFSLSIMYQRLPENVRETLFDPYMARDGNQVRFSIRIIDSDKNLNRDALLKKIRRDLNDKFGFSEEQIHLSGMAVLYNNMLQSLFRSQILTIGIVFLAILLMFIVLFRSLLISLIAIMPNIIAAGMVLGLMGLLNIPLNIMTITIAAITIGIAVDDTIHFIHRFSEEFAEDGDYWATVKRCHVSIGRAMTYTSIIITLGFSILALSNFIPTIYFGLLTGFAMMVALIANLTLLPILLVKFRPFGKTQAVAG